MTEDVYNSGLKNIFQKSYFLGPYADMKVRTG